MTEENFTNIWDNTTTKNITENEFCDLKEFYAAYKGVHWHISLLVCLFGSIANTLNIIVLTRKEMLTPTNIILTGLAIADLCVMIDYIPYSIIMLNKLYSYNHAALVLFHANFTQLCHTASIWLTVLLAVWRYIAVAYPQKNRDWCKMRTTVVTILMIYVLCLMILIPQYFLLEIKDVNRNNKTFYIVQQRQTDSKVLQDINYWIYSFLMKLIPCVLLTFLSFRLIFALIKTKKRREKLVNSSNLLNNENSTRPSIKKSRKLVDKEKQTDRTTKMLLAVLLLFLITEFPQGILGLLANILGDRFYKNCYHPLGDVLDILALFNSAINFMIYCTMSRQFRKTFSLLFKPKILNKWMPVHQLNNSEKDMTQVTQV